MCVTYSQALLLHVHITGQNVKFCMQDIHACPLYTLNKLFWCVYTFILICTHIYFDLYTHLFWFVYTSKYRRTRREKLHARYIHIFPLFDVIHTHFMTDVVIKDNRTKRETLRNDAWGHKHRYVCVCLWMCMHVCIRVIFVAISTYMVFWRKFNILTCTNTYIHTYIHSRTDYRSVSLNKRRKKAIYMHACIHTYIH